MIIGADADLAPRGGNEQAEGDRIAPAVGFEPTTNRLTADRSTTELRWNRFSLNLARELCASIGQRQARFCPLGRSAENCLRGAGFKPTVPRLQDYDSDLAQVDSQLV